MNKLITVFIFFFSLSTFGQIETNWLELRDVHYKSEYNEEYDSYFQVPFLEKRLKNLQIKK